MNEWTLTPDQWCATICAQLLVSVTRSENVVVVRTFAGAAPMLAAALESATLDTVLTVAGNDTVMLIAHAPDQAARLADGLLTTAGGMAASVPGSSWTSRAGSPGFEPNDSRPLDAPASDQYRQLDGETPYVVQERRPKAAKMVRKYHDEVRYDEMAQ